MEWFLEQRPQLAALISNWHIPGRGNRSLFSLLRGHRMRALLKRMLDQHRFPIRLRRAFCLEDPRARAVSFRDRRQRPTKSVTGRRNLSAGCSAATPTGAARSGCRSTISSSSRCNDSTNTTATISKWSARPGPGNLSLIIDVADEFEPPVDAPVPERRRRPAARAKISSQARDRPAFPRLRVVPRIFSWRHRSRRWRFASDGLDRPGGETPSTAPRIGTCDAVGRPLTHAARTAEAENTVEIAHPGGTCPRKRPSSTSPRLLDDQPMPSRLGDPVPPTAKTTRPPN